jgi:hypothetical protein
MSDDVRRIPPGVYFIREQGGGKSEQGEVRRVVVVE